MRKLTEEDKENILKSSTFDNWISTKKSSLLFDIPINSIYWFRRKNNLKVPLNSRICPQCNKSFLSNHFSQKYCSENCCREYLYAKWYKHKKYNKKCEGCGKEFITNHSRKKYCNEECYREKRLGKRWKKSCLQCGQLVDVVGRTRKDFCSNHCSGLYRYKKVEYATTCLYCKNLFLSDTSHKQYCSKECYHNGIGKKLHKGYYKPRHNIVEKICKVCKKEFITRVHNQIYCSKKCYNKVTLIRYYGKKIKIIKKCKQCGTSFEIWERKLLPHTKGKKKKIFCSLKCGKIYWGNKKHGHLIRWNLSLENFLKKKYPKILNEYHQNQF